MRSPALPVTSSTPTGFSQNQEGRADGHTARSRGEAFRRTPSARSVCPTRPTSVTPGAACPASPTAPAPPPSTIARPRTVELSISLASSSLPPACFHGILVPSVIGWRQPEGERKRATKPTDRRLSSLYLSLARGTGRPGSVGRPSALAPAACLTKSPSLIFFVREEDAYLCLAVAEGESTW